MASGRYGKRLKGTNDLAFYADVLVDRGVHVIQQYMTPEFSFPSMSEMSSLGIVVHTWRMGDRFFKLSHKYYGSAELWWVIAYFNKKPTEAHLKYGDIIHIPTPASAVIAIFQRPIEG